MQFTSPPEGMSYDDFPAWMKITSKALKYHLFRKPVGRSVCGNYLLPIAYRIDVQPDDDETKRCKTCMRGVRK